MGPIIDQAALLDSLRDGSIANAALDVYESEPLDADDPLVRLSNVLLTGHMASRTMAAAVGMVEAAIEGVIDLSRGEAPAKGRILNPEVGSLERMRIS